MGFKRPFDEELFQEFPLKHPKQVDCGNRLTSFTEVCSCYEPTQKVEIPCEGGGLFCKSKLGDGFEYDGRNVASDLAEKEFEISAPLSWFTSGTRERDAAVSGNTVCSSLPPGYFEFYFQRRSIIQFGNSYSSLLDGSPRRQVPIGPNHQANVPVWDPQAIEKYSSGSDRVGDACWGKLMGDCIFLMPDSELSAQYCARVGDGRKDCLCPDQGSVRCVQKHVLEARERVRETLGHEKFVQLGFCDMGEEVSQKWTEEEEWVFHEVVYSNPVSHGKNFWEHLSVMFPSRTKKEIVSYYFNVFMLRRRAVQNRSDFLEIDSDDDEWQGSGWGPFGVPQEESAIDSLADHDVCMGREDNSSDGYDDDYGEDDDKGDSDDGDARNGGNITENDGGRNLLTRAQVGPSLVDCKSEFVLHPVGKNFGSDGDNFDDKNVSCIAFECHPNIVESFGSADRRAAVQEIGIKSMHKEGGLHSSDDGSTHGVNPGYLFEPGDAKVWPARYPTTPLISVDLLPTGNIIEEIFGSCTHNNKSSDEKSIS